jgi:predicted NBD/HSP70 family sugar kinase
MPIDTVTTHRRRVLRVPHVRATNQAAVLHLLRRHQRLSRAEIARRTGLSEAAVSRIVARLISRNLVVEQGGEDLTGGRPGIRLQLNEDLFQAFGVDVQNWETRVSLGTITGRVLETQRFRTPSSPEKTLKAIGEVIETHAPKSSRLGGHGVGVSVRGLVNSETGVVALGNDPSWVRVEVKRHLEEQLDRPVFVENNVRAAALAEYHYGSPDVQGVHCLLFVMVYDGVGMGIVLDGKLYRGPRMAAGEFGQMVIDDRPGAERHDRPGCVEMLASDNSTVDRYHNLSGKPKSSFGGVHEQMNRICHLAMSGDAAARQVILDTSRYLGIAISNVVWSLDAEAVVVDGTLTEAWPLVYAAIRDQFPDGRRFLNFRNLALRPSSLGGEATIIGAITLPFAPLFSSESSPQG